MVFAFNSVNLAADEQKPLLWGVEAEEGESGILTSCPPAEPPPAPNPHRDPRTPNPGANLDVLLKPSSGAPPRSILKSQMIQGEDALTWSHFEATSSAALRTLVLMSVHI